MKKLILILLVLFYVPSAFAQFAGGGGGYCIYGCFSSTGTVNSIPGMLGSSTAGYTCEWRWYSNFGGGGTPVGGPGNPGGGNTGGGGVGTFPGGTSPSEINCGSVEHHEEVCTAQCNGRYPLAGVGQDCDVAIGSNHMGRGILDCVRTATNLWFSDGCTTTAEPDGSSPP